MSEEERVHEETRLGALDDGFRPTDVGNADRLVAAAAGRARFVHAWQKWIVYTDGRWAIDTGDALVTELAKLVPRVMFARAARLEGDARDAMWKWARRSETASAVASMIRLARGIPGVIVDHQALDADPWSLNVVNGTVDLRTGELRVHDPDDLLTMQAPTVYDPTAAAPLWERCLERWQPDPAMRAYLRRVIGSGATGHPVENCFVNIGPGGNGKGKCFGAVARVLGPYVMVPHKSLLVVQRHEQHETTIAELFRARLAIAGETDAGDRLDEAKVKNLTGGDLLEARRMREDRWKFHPSHTLVVHSNHRPRVRGSDEGIWRRLRLIPWTVTIPPAERDDQLAAKLTAEAPGILNWIVAGAVAWIAHGLDEPAAVTRATADYRASEDRVGAFIAECCELDDSYQVASTALRAEYERWSAASGEEPIAKDLWGKILTERGFDRHRDRRSRVGLRLASAPAAPVSLFPTRAHAHTGLTGTPELPARPLQHNGTHDTTDEHEPDFLARERAERLELDDEPDDLGAWCTDVDVDHDA